MERLVFIISALFFVLSLVNAQGTPRVESANCSTFDWSPPSAFVRAGEPQRVSGALNCNNVRIATNRSCALAAEGDLAVRAQYNISSSLFNSTFLANVINETVFRDPFAKLPYLGFVLPFQDYLIGLIDTIQILPPGDTGYLNFTPYYMCYTGTLSNCTDIDDTFAIEACTPAWHSIESNDPNLDAFPILDGEYVIQNIPLGDVPLYNNPFANQSRGGTSASSRLGADLTALLALAVGVAFFLL